MLSKLLKSLNRIMMKIEKEEGDQNKWIKTEKEREKEREKEKKRSSVGK
jgi:hypothetical protein